MSNLTRKDNNLTLRQRVEQALAQKPGGDPAARPQSSGTKAHGRDTCLLLDVSGSMAEPVDLRDWNTRKIDALRKLAKGFPDVRQFAFSHQCAEVTSIPEPQTSTDMAAAFLAIKAAGITHAVLITDGLPDSETLALRCAAGLRLDILYVGPPPKPDFLRRLAEATGGSYQQSTLTKQAVPQLQSRIRGLLGA